MINKKCTVERYENDKKKKGNELCSKNSKIQKFKNSKFDTKNSARSVMPVLTLGTTGGGGRGFLDRRSNIIAAIIIQNDDNHVK